MNADVGVCAAAKSWLMFGGKKFLSIDNISHNLINEIKSDPNR